MEGAGEFAALNLNTDRAGLSFGLLQWAQKPGRLAERLAVFRTANTDQFAEIFGGSDTANRLMKHAPKTNGGISPATGETTDPAFDLIREPWISRFRRAASSRAFQKVQVETAMASFRNSHESPLRAGTLFRSKVSPSCSIWQTSSATKERAASTTRFAAMGWQKPNCWRQSPRSPLAAFGPSSRTPRMRADVAS